MINAKILPKTQDYNWEFYKNKSKTNEMAEFKPN